LSHTFNRQDLANIVRRRGYKLVKELLLTSKQPTYECIGEDRLVEKSEDESLGQQFLSLCILGCNNMANFGFFRLTTY